MKCQISHLAVRIITTIKIVHLRLSYYPPYFQAETRLFPAPEKLLRELLLQVLYSVRSERLLMEECNYNMLFRWFVGLNMDDWVWDPTNFTKNRERLLRGDIAKRFFAGVLDQARGDELLSDEHFTVDGTLLEAAASLKSSKSKDEPDEPPPDDPGNPTVNFHGPKRSNKTHQSITDPEAMSGRKGKGKEAKLRYAGNLVMENLILRLARRIQTLRRQTLSGMCSFQ